MRAHSGSAIRILGSCVAAIALLAHTTSAQDAPRPVAQGEPQQAARKPSADGEQRGGQKRQFGFSIEAEAMDRIQSMLPLRVLLGSRHKALQIGMLSTDEVRPDERRFIEVLRASLRGRIEAWFRSDKVQDLRFRVADRDAQAALNSMLRQNLGDPSSREQLADSPMVSTIWTKDSFALKSTWRGRNASALLASGLEEDGKGAKLVALRRRGQKAKSGERAKIESWLSFEALGLSEPEILSATRIESDVEAMRVASKQSSAHSRERIRILHPGFDKPVFRAGSAALAEVAKYLPEDLVFAARACFAPDVDVLALIRGVTSLTGQDFVEGIADGLANSPLAVKGRLPSDVTLAFLTPKGSATMPEPLLCFRIGDRECSPRAVLMAIQAAVRAQLTKNNEVGKAGRGIRQLGKGTSAIPYLRLDEVGEIETDILVVTRMILAGASLSAIRLGPWFMLTCSPRSARRLRRIDPAKSLATRLAARPDGPSGTTPMEVWLDAASLSKRSSAFVEIIAPIASFAVTIVQQVVGAVAGANPVRINPGALSSRPIYEFLADCGVERIHVLAQDASERCITLERQGSGVLSPAAWNLSAQLWHARSVLKQLRAK